MNDRLYREELAARGRARLADYSWQATAERFARSVEHVVGIAGATRRAA